MTPDRAETVALLVLGWLAGNEDLLPVFLGATGADAAALRAGAGDPAFLSGVLRFLTMNDTWIVACCDAVGLAYTDPMRALQALPGTAPDWT